MQERIKCKICNKSYNHLGSHIWHGHKITAKEYKSEFELPFDMPLISESVQEKKRIKEEINPTWKENFKNSKKYQFKKGQTGLRRVSEYEKKSIIKRLEGIHKRHSSYKPCPVCKTKYRHVESHLYNKHRLLIAV